MNRDELLGRIVTPQRHAMIRAEQGQHGPIWKLQVDVVVIGSGSGGAVAAAELSAHGWRVALIEEGSFFDAARFSNDEFVSLSHMYRDGGVIAEEEGRVAILQGRTLGGSTTVNWQASLYPPEYVTDEWRERFGLAGYGRDDMAPYIDAVHRRLGVHEVDDGQVNENNAVLLRGARALGYKPERLKNNSVNCEGLGRCGLGCPVNAKQSMSLTFIPDAIGAGAMVITNMRAVKIEDGEVKRVTTEYSPDPSQPAPSGVFEQIDIAACVVVLSAGAIETPALLLRSGLGNAMVGKHLKLHPTTTIFAKFEHDIAMFSGVPQSVVIKEGHYQERGYGFWIEAAPYRPTTTLGLMPFFGKKQFEVMKEFRNYHAGIVLVRDGADGPVKSSVTWNGERRVIHYHIADGEVRNMLRGLKMLAEIQTAAGATHLVFPFRRLTEPMPVQKGQNFDWVLSEPASSFFTIGSAHPHGSVQAAADASLGAVDANFELYGSRNIFVMDASVFPTGLSVNPQISTMASVMRAARRLSLSKGKTLSRV